MADFFKLSLVLQAAEMLEQPKAQMLFPTAPALRVRRPAPPVSDDGAVPDVGAIRPARQRSPFAYDEEGTVSDDGSSTLDADELASKRMRLASSRMLARNLDTHNSVEKRRRAYLASCYEGLKESVPMLAGSRASNVKVLRGAASYIKPQTLQNEEQRLIAEKKRLREVQDELLRQREKRLRDSESAATVPTAVYHAPALPATPVGRPSAPIVTVLHAHAHASPSALTSAAPALSHASPALSHPAPATPALSAPAVPFAAPSTWPMAVTRAARRTSSDNDVAFTLMKLSGIAAQ